MKPGGRKATSGLRLLLAAALAGLLLRGPAAVASADGLVGGPLPAWVAGAGSRATSKGLPAALHNPAGLAVPTAFHWPWAAGGPLPRGEATPQRCGSSCRPPWRAAARYP